MITIDVIRGGRIIKMRQRSDGYWERYQPARYGEEVICE